MAACNSALYYYAGVPKAIVPDNLKSAVVKSYRNEHVINEEFAYFAEFFNCAGYSTTVRYPKDKTLADNTEN